MNRRIKFILLAGVLALALGGGLLWNQRAPVPPVAEEEGLQLTQRPVQDITLMMVENQAGGYTLRNQGEGHFSDEALGNLPQDGASTQAALEAAKDLTTAKVVAKAPGNLSQYGLVPPKATVTIHYSDGELLQVLVGGEAPGGAGVYFTTGDGETIYETERGRLAPFSQGEQSFVSRVLGEGAKPIEVSRILLTGRNYGEEILLESIPTNEVTGAEQQVGRGLHRMVEPRQGQADSEFVNTLIEKAMDLTALEVVTVEPSPQEIGAAGLAEPAAILTLQYGEGKEMTLRATRGEDGALLLMKEGLPVLYRVAAEDCPWFEAGVGEFISLRLLAPNLEGLGELTLAGAGEGYTFILTGEGENLAVRCNEQAIDPRGFTEFYTLLTELAGESGEGLMPTGEPLLKIIYGYRAAGKGADTVAFYPGPSEETIAVTVGGKGALVLPRSSMEKLLEGAAEAAEKTLEE